MSRRPVPAPTRAPMDRSQLEYLWNIHTGPEGKGTADPIGLIQQLIVNLDQALMKLEEVKPPLLVLTDGLGNSHGVRYSTDGVSL